MIKIMNEIPDELFSVKIQMPIKRADIREFVKIKSKLTDIKQKRKGISIYQAVNDLLDK